MLQQQDAPSTKENNGFGTLIFSWRGRIKRTKILDHLQGWSKDVLYRLENGETAPVFAQLCALYRALWLANCQIPPDGPQLFLLAAKARIGNKGTHLDYHTSEEWAELGDDLMRIDYEFRSRSHPSTSLDMNPLLLDTSHLIKRETWHYQMRQYLREADRKKVIILPGPSGIGKTSELSLFALDLRRSNSHRPIMCDFLAASPERLLAPDEALTVFFGTVLSALGYSQPQTPPLLDDLVKLLLEQIGRSTLPVVLVVDHAECILEHGKLALCWERFLGRLLKYQHKATLVLALKQWPSWFSGDAHFLIEVPLPPLSLEQGVVRLQRLGLQAVPQDLLRRLCEKVGGVPLSLEWAAALSLSQQYMFIGDVDPSIQSSGETSSSHLIRAVRQLLDEPHIFGGVFAEEIAPLLERLLSHYHLPAESQELLQLISLATVPLAKPALDVLFPGWARSIRELHRASLLVAYHDRAQALPGVAAAVLQGLSVEERIRWEETLIEAYQAWLTGEGSFFYENEKGILVTELAALQLAHHQLLQAAQTLIRHGWLAFNLGHAARLARLARKAIEEWERMRGEQQDQAAESGKWLLSYFLFPFLGEKINVEERFTNYQRMLGWITGSVVIVRPPTELFVVRHLSVHLMNRGHYSEAGALVEACEQRLAASIATDPDLQAAVLETWGFFYTAVCENEEKQKNLEAARSLRQQAIAVYRRSQSLLNQAKAHATPLKSSFLLKRLARALTNLGFHLSRIEEYDAAIEVLRESVALKEEGYTEPGSLPASYGDLSQAMLGAGLLTEAEQYDTLAWDTIHQMAEAGDSLSRENTRIYYVNRARLYIRLGRLDEAEGLLRDALDNLPERWDMYRQFARQALDEIERKRSADAE